MARFISATEIATWDYCPMAWRLRHYYRLPNGNKEKMYLGRLRHRQWRHQKYKKHETSASDGVYVFGGIVGIAFIAMLLSFVYLRDILPASPIVIYLAFLALSLVMAISISFYDSVRKRVSKPGSQVISEDNLTLYSHRYGLSGRPDRIIRTRKGIIPIEKKSGYSARRYHFMQLAAYLLIVQDVFQHVPPYGILELGGGRRIRVPFTQNMVDYVIFCANQIRHAREDRAWLPSLQVTANQCYSCSQRENCRVRVW